MSNNPSESFLSRNWESDTEAHPLSDRDSLHDHIDGEHIPQRRRRVWDLLVNGPSHPRNPHVTQFFPKLQRLPLRLKKTVPFWLRRTCLVGGFLLWALIFSSFAKSSILAEAEIDGNSNVSFLRCSQNYEQWLGPNAECGLDGEDCAREVGELLFFKCSANCWRESWAYRPYVAGLHVSYHEPFVVGGNNIYRGDSFLCAAALHRGIISDYRGGGGIIRFLGPQQSFEGGPGNESMVSFPFDSEFPSSFEFIEPVTVKGVHDYRMAMALTSFVAILLFGFFLTSPIVFLFIAATIGLWTVILASNPPLNGGDPESNAELISLGVRRLLPCLLGTYVIWHVATKPQLDGMHAYLSRSLLWGIPFFCGIVENYVFGKIPIDRLTVSDLNGQAGAWASAIIIGIIIIAIAFGQAYVIWRQGRLLKFLRGYGLCALAILILASVPNQTLRIHHYILALVLLPGTGLQTSASLVYQGLLVGLYVAGVARWDFDSILQTYVQLARGGPQNLVETPHFLPPTIKDDDLGDTLKKIIINWAPLEESVSELARNLWGGFSLVINDVERYRGNATSFDLTSWVFETLEEPYPQNYYIRLAVADLYSPHTGDFTLAGVFDILNGTWTDPLPGKV